MANDDAKLPTTTRRRRFLGLLCCALALIVLVATLAVLRFGNTQWCRWIYIFQAHIWPGRTPEPPPSYSGPWEEWHINGQRSLIGWARESKAVGPVISWDEDGHIRHVDTRVARGEPGTLRFLRQGTEISWDADGREISVGRNVGDDHFDGTFYNWNLDVLNEYRRGEPFDGFFWLHGGEMRVVKQGTVLYDESFTHKDVGKWLKSAQQETVEVLERNAQRWDRLEPLDAKSGNANE